MIQLKRNIRHKWNKLDGAEDDLIRFDKFT